MREFVIPGGLSAPHAIAVDGDGRVWFAEKVGRNLASFDFAEKRFESHPLPESWGNLGPSRIALAADGRVWFTVRRGAESETPINLLGEFEVASGKFRKHVLPGALRPEDLTLDAAGKVWFLAPDQNGVFRFDPGSGALQGFAIPTPNSYPKGIAIDGQGSIWFAEANVNKIAKLVPEESAIAEYEIPAQFANPGGVAIDGSGRVWFNELRANAIGVFYPDLMRFDEAPIPTPRGLPSALVADGEGRIWFLEYRGNKVGMFDPKGAYFNEFDIPSYASFPTALAFDGKAGRLWFSLSSTEVKRLGHLSLAEARAWNPGLAAKAAQATPRQTSTSLLQIIGYMVVAVGALLLLISGGLFIVLARRKSGA
ncbi:MAG: hypothetical protein CMM08_20055 [Rhodospirillaceae bacterium]|nr:hypothetical protein [Rhodospirillaceae bacterium]